MLDLLLVSVVDKLSIDICSHQLLAQWRPSLCGSLAAERPAGAGSGALLRWWLLAGWATLCLLARAAMCVAVGRANLLSNHWLTRKKLHTVFLLTV